MAKKDKRFIEAYKEQSGIFGPESSLVVDKNTGVTYLIINNLYGTGVTPLLDKDGKPVISNIDDKEIDK